MLIFSITIRRAVTSLKCLYPLRVFSISIPNAGSKQASIKTVKAFDDLPSTYMLTDGSTAKPLTEWWAGPNRSPKIESSAPLDLVGENNPPRKRARVGKPLRNVNENSSTLAAVSQATRNKKAKLRGSVDMHPNDSHALSKVDTDPVIRPKRGRKTKFDESSTTKEKDVPKPVTTSKRRKKTEPNESSTQNAATKAQPSELSGFPQTVLAQEILENLRRFPHCLLLTRVGQFYESYFDQAQEIARLLNIKLTTKKWGVGRIPMCGFPLVHLDKNLKVLVQQHNRFVAMCEEFPIYAEGVKTFERRVTRVITPGTLIDEPFLNPFENNYLLAVSISQPEDFTAVGPIGLAWIDISTGDFFSKSATMDNLRDELTRIAPKEVVLHNSLEHYKQHPIFGALAEDDNLVSFLTLPSFGNASSTSENADINAIPAFKPPQLMFGVTNLDIGPGQSDSKDLGITLSPEETSAISLITSYLHANLLEYMPALSSPNRESVEERMQIDSHTIKALEIREGFREGGIKGSLFGTIKRTVTSGGSRLLSRWLCSPSTSIAEINARQSLVAFFHARPHFQVDLAEALAETEDTGRIVQKFSLGRGDTSDLLSVKRTARMWTKITKRVEHEKSIEVTERTHFNAEEWASLDALVSRVVELDELSKIISAALEDSPSGMDQESLESVHEIGLVEGKTDASENNSIWRYGPAKWTIKPEFSPTLKALHESLDSLLRKREKLERAFQLKYDAPSLTLRASPAHGMHVHLAKAKRDQKGLTTSPDFIPIAESGTTRCYFSQEWSRLGSQIAETTLALNIAEKEAFETLRNEVNNHAQLLRRNARLLHELDVAISFAKLATELNFVRPTLTDDAIYLVKNGRHPSVELGLLEAGRTFTPNSTELSSTSRLHIITGPNMAGKSTFLRQTALIAILAQSGSFVPADSATIGVVDKLFSRIGAKDDLFHDRSTFMVEMLETAEILRRATPRSLVIMDEVGRGTTVSDGLAIAYASLHHLASINQCRALFATHFHELFDLLGHSSPLGARDIFNCAAFFCTDVVETNDEHFAYQYQIRPGVNRNSHGLKVAQLAGMPHTALEVAKDVLCQLRAREAGQQNFNIDHPIDSI